MLGSSTQKRPGETRTSVRLCMDASMAALAFRLLRALISRIFSATDSQKKSQFPIQILESITAFTPKKPAFLPRW